MLSENLLGSYPLKRRDGRYAKIPTWKNIYHGDGCHRDALKGIYGLLVGKQKAVAFLIPAQNSLSWLE